MKIQKSKLATLIAGLFMATSLNLVNATELSQQEAETLTFMHEEEKLARDVYRTLYEKWGIRAFSNIANSEQRHMDALANQLEQYNLVNRITDDSIGYFVDPNLASIYNDLTTKGLESEMDALMVGAYIEELDIMDLQKAIEESAQTSLDSVYANLMRGSRNHLRAFTKNIELRGTDYVAQLMPQEEVDAIMDSPQERGNGHGMGQNGMNNGTGKGHGMGQGGMGNSSGRGHGMGQNGMGGRNK